MRLRAGWRLMVLPISSALIAAMVLAVVGTVAYRQNRETVQAQAEARVRSNANAASRAVTRQARDYLRTVRATAQDASVVAALSRPGPRTTSAAAGPLATLAVGKAAPSAFLSDRRGRYVSGQPMLGRLVGRGFAYRDWFRGASSSGRPYVSSGYRSVAPGRPLVVGVAAPVQDGNRRVGYLTVTWELASVRSLAAGSRRDDGVSVIVTDQRGQPLVTALTVDDRGQPRSVQVAPVTKRALAGERLDTIMGGNVVAAGPVATLGWTVTATLPVSAAMAPAREFRNSLLLALAIAYLTLLCALAYALLITLRRARERGLVSEQAKRLTALFAASPVGIIEGLPDGTIVAANDALTQMLGYSMDELLQMRASELSHPSSKADVVAALTGVLDGSVRSYTGERSYRTRSGETVQALVSVVVLRDAAGELERMVAFIADLSGLRATEAALRSTENRFRQLLDAGLIGKALTSDTGVILRANHALATCLGFAVDELRGRPLTSCFAAPEDRLSIADLVAAGSGEMHAEVPLRGSTQDEVWANVAVHWVQEQNAEWVLLAQFEDITERRAAKQRLTELALHDDLTGLPNRRLLMERCEQVFAIARSGRSGSCVTALFIDLDGFKAVNDRVGHQAGDGLLNSIATDLVGVLRPGDTLARVGGDEFVVLLGTDDGLDAGRRVADRVAGLVRRHIPCGKQTSLAISASIGIARVDLSTEPEVEPEQLLRRADAAMYRAKQHGRDRHEIFDSDLLATTEARYELEQAVRDGLLHDRIALVYQAVVDVDSGEVLGAEALMRLHDEAGRLLPTLPAILAAEQAGLAQELGDKVLNLALATLRSWPAHMTLAVNVSARELTGEAFRQRVEDALQRHDVEPTRLVLEVTESSILHAGRASLGALRDLRQTGVRIAIDDFGTAYATLHNLTVLPVDIIKVDASFTAGLGKDRTATAVIRGVTTMAEAMGVPCIIEGVETQSQHDALAGLGVQGQGWLWGRPRGQDVIPTAPERRATTAPTSANVPVARRSPHVGGHR